MSKTLAPKTCGFLPTHLYEGPEFDRASCITAAINSFCLASMGLGNANPKPLNNLTLHDMMEALNIVERHNSKPAIAGVAHSVHMVPADRLIAAVYTLLNFYAAPYDEDGDQIPALLETRHGKHFVLVGTRESLGDEEADDIEDAA